MFCLGMRVCCSSHTWYGNLLRFGRNINRELLADEGEYERCLTHISVAHQEDPDLLPSSTISTLHPRNLRSGDETGVSEMSYINSFFIHIRKTAKIFA